MEQQLTYEEAKSLSKNVQTSSNTINELLENSNRTVKNIQNNWQGSSADYAMADWDKWRKDFEEYYQMLIQNVKNIENACNDFAEAEAKMQQSYGE